MPLIMQIKELHNTVAMSNELHDKFARINRIDQAIYESEQEVLNGAEPLDADDVFAELEKKQTASGN